MRLFASHSQLARSLRSTLVCFAAVALGVAATRAFDAARGPVTKIGVPPLPPYPHARWRLVPTPQLDHVVLWVSHIVLLSNASEPRLSRLSIPGWSTSDPPASDRSPEETQRLATGLAQQLRRFPDRFDSVAKEYSDDVVTRDNGGDLGGVRATQLPPEYLDALATLSPGEISRPFRTPYGFHIIRLDRVPAPTVLSWRRVLVRYSDTLGTGPEPARTREQALVRASELRRAVDQRGFAPVMKADSDAREDTLRVLISTDPGDFPREALALQELGPEAVSAPVDSRWGVEILQRVAVPTGLVALVAITIPYAAKGEPFEADAAAAAQDLADRTQTDPSAFDAAREDYCCPKIQIWPQNDGPEVAQVAKALAINEVARRVVRLPDAYAVIRRVPLDAADHELRHEVPHPLHASVDAIVTHSTAGALANSMLALADALSHSNAGSEHARKTSERLLVELSRQVGKEPDAAKRLQAVGAAWLRLERELAEQDYREVQQFANTWIETQLMSRRTM